jgi:putative acetyltransferase
MLIIQQESPKDLNNIYEINKLSFGEETEAKIVNALREADELVLSLVAQIDNKTIGYIAFSEVKIVSENKTHKAIGLGPMAILPEYQRKGYGSKLIEEGLTILTERGYGIVVVLGHPNFYPKFGFIPSEKYGIRCEYECPPEAFMIKELKHNSLMGIGGIVHYSSMFSEV